MKQGSQHCGKKVLIFQKELTVFRIHRRLGETRCSSRCETSSLKDCYRSFRNKKDNPADRTLMKVVWELNLDCHVDKREMYKET